MAYGALRLLYNNLITSVSQLTLSSQADGRISGTKKTGSGVATMAVTGPFKGAFDLSYLIECDSISGGTEVGEATVRWRTSNTATGAYEQTGVLTQTSPVIALSADGLGTNVKIAFTGGVGADFALADSWLFEARATYGGERLLDRNRNTYWKTTGCAAESIVVNHGSAKKITAVVLHDHNLTSGATVKFQAHTANSWGSPAYSYTFATITDPLILYLDQTYQYNRWYFEDASNTDGYIRAGNILATEYLTLSQCNAIWGSSETPGLQVQDNESVSGVLRRYLYAVRTSLDLSFGDTLLNDDIDALITMRDSLIDTDTHRILPLWVHLFYDEPDTLRLMDWQNIASWQRGFFRYLLNSTAMIFREVVKV